MPSLLENLQRRLDDLPIPDVLHRSHSSQLQEPAAGLEASPRLRVRAFPQTQSQSQSQAQQLATGQPRAVNIPRLQISHQLPNRQISSARQVQAGSGPTWGSHAEPPAVRQGRLASDDWLVDLPDTPEAPRAATAAQRQAIADVLFEAAASESAVADNEAGQALQADPSWLDDAATYDAVAAQMDEDDMSALEIVSDEEESPMVIAVRSQARLNLSSLEHLLLSDDDDNDSDDGETATEAGSYVASDAQSSDRQLSGPVQSARLADLVVLDSEEEDDGAGIAAAPHNGSQHSHSSRQHHAHCTASSTTARHVGDIPTAADKSSSPPQVALGHNGRPRPVLSDVTTAFPTEAPQQAQQAAQQAAQQGDQNRSDEGATFQVQRKGKLPRVCRNLLPSAANTAATDTETNSSGSSGQAAPGSRNATTANTAALNSSGSSGQAASASRPGTAADTAGTHAVANSSGSSQSATASRTAADAGRIANGADRTASDASALRATLRSSARPQTQGSASQSTEATASGGAITQTSICTRRQARLNQQASQQNSSGDHALFDSAVKSDEQQSNGSSAAGAANAASDAQSEQLSSQESAVGHVDSASQQVPEPRKIRSRLQLNRKAKPAGAAFVM